MDSISWVLNSTREVNSMSCPFWQQAALSIYFRTFQRMVSIHKQWGPMAHAHFAKTHSSQPSPRTCLLGSLTLPHPCDLPDCQGSVLALCMGDTMAPSLGSKAWNRNWHLFWAQREEQSLSEQSNQYMPVIVLTWTQLTCADRWKWSKARINILGARRGSEGDGMPRCVEQGPRLRHLFVLQEL